MPSANLNLVRSIYAAWESGDFISVDWADSEIEYTMIGGPWRFTGGLSPSVRASACAA